MSLYYNRHGLIILATWEGVSRRSKWTNENIQYCDTHMRARAHSPTYLDAHRNMNMLTCACACAYVPHDIQASHTL